MTRKRLHSKVEAAVLIHCRRRCAICFGLNRDIRVKRGQIAHLDRDHSNDAPANLVFLCLDHHDAYDSVSRQSKGFRAAEVRAYRKELYASVVPAVSAQAPKRAPAETHLTRDSRPRQSARLVAESRTALLELIKKAERLIGHSVAAHTLGLSSATTETLLADLADQGLVRIDREHATLRKTYTLRASPTNRLIDTFVKSLGEEVLSESRYIRKQLTEVDAIVRTRAHAYVVETLVAANGLEPGLITRRARMLTDARRALGLARARRVLLVGITKASTLSSPQLKDLEKGGLLVKYVDLGPA